MLLQLKMFFQSDKRKLAVRHHLNQTCTVHWSKWSSAKNCVEHGGSSTNQSSVTCASVKTWHGCGMVIHPIVGIQTSMDIYIYYYIYIIYIILYYIYIYYIIYYILKIIYIYSVTIPQELGNLLKFSSTMASPSLSPRDRWRQVGHVTGATAAFSRVILGAKEESLLPFIWTVVIIYSWMLIIK